MAKWEEKFLKHIENTADEYIDIKEIEIGRIISFEPLQIMIGELPLYKENLYINSDLLDHTKEFTTLTGTVGDKIITISDGCISFKTPLKDGILVALRQINKNKYLVICKIE